MGWQIKISHEDTEDGTRLTLTANPEIPDDVIAALVSSYWVEEIQIFEDSWDPTDFEPGTGGPSGQLQG